MDSNKDIEKQEATASSSAADTPSQSVSGICKSNFKFGWKDVSYSVDTPKGKKQILQNVNGCVEKGSPLSGCVL